MCLEQHLEEQDYELNARYDYVREAYGATAEDLADDDYAPQAPDGLIEDAATALKFVTGGNATFTLVSARTGDRYTFRARVAKDKPSMFFASTLIGSNNEDDYAYLGFFNAVDGKLVAPFGEVLKAGKKGNPDDRRFKALAWILSALARGHMPTTVEFWHEGRCARCNRLLTDPVSIARGFGPECAGKM